MLCQSPTPLTNRFVLSAMAYSNEMHDSYVRVDGPKGHGKLIVSSLTEHIEVDVRHDIIDSRSVFDAQPDALYRVCASQDPSSEGLLCFNFRNSSSTGTIRES